jgi:hypothetical protein
MAENDVVMTPVKDLKRNLAAGFRLFSRDEFMTWQQEQPGRDELDRLEDQAEDDRADEQARKHAELVRKQADLERRFAAQTERFSRPRGVADTAMWGFVRGFTLDLADIGVGFFDGHAHAVHVEMRAVNPRAAAAGTLVGAIAAAWVVWIWFGWRVPEWWRRRRAARAQRGVSAAR